MVGGCDYGLGWGESVVGGCDYGLGFEFDWKSKVCLYSQNSRALWGLSENSVFHILTCWPNLHYK